MRLLNETELWARFRRLSWLPAGSAILITPYTKVNVVGIAAFAYLMTYLHKSGVFQIDEKDTSRIEAMMLGEFTQPKNKPVRVITLPDAQYSRGLASSANKAISAFQPEIITSLFILTSTLGQKLEEDAGLICRGLLKDDLLKELAGWDMKIKWDLEDNGSDLPILSFQIMCSLTRVALVQIDPWSGTFRVNEQPTQKLFTEYRDFKEIVLAQVDRYLEIATG